MTVVQGPNVRRLIAHKMSVDAIPAGGGVVSAIEFLSSRDKISSGAKAAAQWVEDAIAAVRNAASPNQFVHSTDEEIAETILKEVWKKTGRCDRCGGYLMHSRLSGMRCVNSRCCGSEVG